MKNRFLLLLATVIGLFVSLNAQTDSIDVLHYDINLNIDNIIPKGHVGYTAITFNLITDDYHKVKFSLQNQTVDSVFVGNEQNASPLQKTDFTVEGNNIIFSVPDLSVKENYTAIVYYHGASTVEKNTSAWGGMHYDNDIIYSMGVAFMDYPHSYARSWFVVNESFSDKATYDFYISVDKDKQAVCSGNLTEKISNEAFDTYHYTLEQKVAPYLVAVTVGKFYTYTKLIHSQTYDYDIELVVNYTNALDSANIVHNFYRIEDAFNEMEKHFGKFRFNRLGYTVTPIGSMEHVDNICLARGVITDTSIEAVSNIVHEMGHSWFGNLATCQTAEDMWLNEGWTTYTTRLSLQAIYGEERMKEYWRQKHLWVLETLPLQEGIRPVTPVDSSLTYSSTVYQKGAMVATTLQGYFSQNETLFFNAVKTMLDSFEFANYNSYQMRDFIAAYTGDSHFTDFFNYLVFEDKQINYDVEDVADYGYKFTFNYDEYANVLNIPVSETNGVLVADYKEQIMSLNTDNLIRFTQNGTYKQSETYSKIKVNGYNNDYSERITLHWTGPKYTNLPYGIERISSKHYWSVKQNPYCTQTDDLQLYFELSDSKNAFDNSLVSDYNGLDSLFVLYRPTPSSDWSVIDAQIPNDNKGYVTIKNHVMGDYVFAVGDKQKVGLNASKEKTFEVNVYPNPSHNKISIDCQMWNNTKVTVFDVSGRELDTFILMSEKTDYTFKEKGNYTLKFVKNNLISVKQIIVD